MMKQVDKVVNMLKQEGSEGQSCCHSPKLSLVRSKEKWMRRKVNTGVTWTAFSFRLVPPGKNITAAPSSVGMWTRSF